MAVFVYNKWVFKFQSIVVDLHTIRHLSSKKLKNQTTHVILFYYNIMSGVGISYTNEGCVTFAFYLWLVCCDFVVELNIWLKTGAE